MKGFVFFSLRADVRNASIRLWTNSTAPAAAAENHVYSFPTVYNFAFTFFFTIILIFRKRLPVITSERLKVKRYTAYKKQLCHPAAASFQQCAHL